MIDSFEGRVAVVTGGASGIGRSLASLCAARGMHVVIADVEKEALERTAGLLSAESFCTDVTDPSSVGALADFVHERFGQCDLLCNNAGVGGQGRIVDQTLNDWRWLVEVNLMGVAHVLHAFLPQMVERGQGHVVNTASIAGLTAFVSGPYTATKYAVVGISETLRHELLGTGVGVSVLCPGFVRTKINRSDRNRPVHLANGTDTSGAALILSAVAPVLADAQPVLLEPDDVAAITLDAVQRDDFWIVTDPSILALAVPRYDELNAIIASAPTSTGEQL